MAGFDHRPALLPAHHLSPLAKIPLHRQLPDLCVQILAQVPKETKSATLSRISPIRRRGGNQSSGFRRHCLQNWRGIFTLGWSHYVTLLSIDDADARHFYEIEAADGGWSVCELKREIDRSLYERLALSRDKREVRWLAREGQVVEKAADLIKDPVVLEFLGLEERPTYSESELETAIIDRLQQFLLALDYMLIVPQRIIRSFKGNILLVCFQLVTGGARRGMRYAGRFETRPYEPSTVSA